MTQKAFKLTRVWIGSVSVASENGNESEIWNGTFLISWICWRSAFCPLLYATGKTCPSTHASILNTQVNTDRLYNNQSLWLRRTWLDGCRYGGLSLSHALHHVLQFFSSSLRSQLRRLHNGVVGMVDPNITQKEFKADTITIRVTCEK